MNKGVKKEGGRSKKRKEEKNNINQMCFFFLSFQAFHLLYVTQECYKHCFIPGLQVRSLWFRQTFCKLPKFGLEGSEANNSAEQRWFQRCFLGLRHVLLLQWMPSPALRVTPSRADAYVRHTGYLQGLERLLCFVPIFTGFVLEDWKQEMHRA